VQVAVPRVEDIGDEQTVALADGHHLAHDLRQLAARHHGVLQQVRRGEAPDGAGGLLAALPQERALGSSRATLTDSAPCSRQIAAARSACASTSARGPIQLDQQHRARPSG
jgi:hypothetical protein